MKTNQKRNSRWILDLIFLSFIFFVCLLYLFGSSDGFVGSGSNQAKQYLGTWKGVLAGDKITIKELSPDAKQPFPEIDADGRADLLLPIATPNMPYGSVGGIYKKGGHHLFVLWCETCTNNVVFRIKRMENEIHIGTPDAFPISINAQMCVGHNARHRKDDPKKWIIYKRVSQ